jgi:hypothetical protein
MNASSLTWEPASGFSPHPDPTTGGGPATPTARCGTGQGGSRAVAWVESGLGGPNGWRMTCSPRCPPREVRRADGATAAGAVVIRIRRLCTDRAGAPIGACQPA